MALTHPEIEEFSFAAEKAGSSAASALRKIKPLTETLPAGRLFEAIATLTDKSAAAAVEYEKAALAHLRQEIAEAEASITRANRLADELNAELDAQIPIPLPDFLKRKR